VPETEEPEKGSLLGSPIKNTGANMDIDSLIRFKREIYPELDQDKVAGIVLWHAVQNGGTDKHRKYIHESNDARLYIKHIDRYMHHSLVTRLSMITRALVEDRMEYD
jgi:hypothetical protein